ncbi:hypothetical protein QO034_10580 [Sedimentitalea sp. JM2-8]|uniref:Small-conductance mechanosensitive channel n=1 Tax=Sedimentitalea xiamensis TaxID=3050037 RepID=A0ABT7FEP6_9RHOB|nr:hypothetical protein [Sedimentitalea xiamensis]MDK3073557.1 hypothetical protein [Sedimentitalea xiamensis]
MTGLPEVDLWAKLTTIFGVYTMPLVSTLVGVALFILAPRILGPVASPDRKSLQISLLRLVTVAFILLQLADLVFHKLLEVDYDRLLLRASASIVLIYGMMVAFNILARLLEAKFGRSREIDGTKVTQASYHSRMATLVMIVIMLLCGLLALLQIWNLGSLIERTGFIGIIAAFIFLTHSVWFPDMYFGLTLLGSSMANEGETIRFDSDGPIYIINRLTPFYVLLLNLDSNERVIMRNAKLFEGTIENLNKRASIEGLRRRVELKISYPENESVAENREALFARVEAAVGATFEALAERKDLHVNANVPMTWLLADAGDFALQVSVFFHLDPLPETKLTKVVRRYLRWTPAAVRHHLYEECATRGLYLATPGLLQVSTGQETPGFVVGNP